MALQYEICGDEAWTHVNKPLNRYWCFWGGLLAQANEMDHLETELRKTVDQLVIMRYGHRNDEA
jgi:hypothetical protein